MKTSSLTHFLKKFQKLHSAQTFLLIAVLGLAAYSNAIVHPFVHDDVVFIQKNPTIDTIDLTSIILNKNQTAPTSSIINVYYRPLLEIIYRLQYKIFHLNPFGYHLFNILIHILNAFLIFKLLYFIWPKRKGMSFTVAILFLVHPLQSEAVACIAGISNLVFASLFLLSFYCYLISFKGDHSLRRLGLYFTSLLLFFLSFFAKEQAIVLPVLMIFYEWCRSKGAWKSETGKLFRLAGYFLVLAGYFLLRKMILGVTVTSIFESSGEFWLRILSIPGTLLTYFGLIVFPHGLHYYRSVDILSPFLVPLLILIFVLLLMIVTIMIVRKNHRQWLLFGLGWFFIIISPTLNIVPLINEYSYILTSEHFLYLPLVGALIYLVILVSVISKKIFKANEQKANIILLTIVVVIFTTLTMKQNTYWRSEIALFKRTLKYQPNFGRVRILLGKAYYQNQQYEQSIVEFEKAIEIMRGYSEKVEDQRALAFYLGFIKGAYFELAHSYEGLGQWVSAISHYKQALNIDPKDDVILNNVGVAYTKINNFDRAIDYFRQSFELNPGNVMALKNLHASYMLIGEKDKARQLEVNFKNIR